MSTPTPPAHEPPGHERAQPEEQGETREERLDRLAHELDIANNSASDQVGKPQ